MSAALLALEATAEWAAAEPRRWRESPRLAAMAVQAAPPPRLLEAFRNAFESSGGGGGVGSGSGGGGGGVRLSSKGFARLGARRVRAAGAARATSDAMGALLRQVRAVAAPSLSLSLSPSPSLSLSLSLSLAISLSLSLSLSLSHLRRDGRAVVPGVAFLPNLGTYP